MGALQCGQPPPLSGVARGCLFICRQCELGAVCIRSVAWLSLCKPLLSPTQDLLRPCSRCAHTLTQATQRVRARCAVYAAPTQSLCSATQRLRSGCAGQPSGPPRPAQALCSRTQAAGGIRSLRSGCVALCRQWLRGAVYAAQTVTQPWRCVRASSALSGCVTGGLSGRVEPC
jgi:hypothetical protein